MKLPFTISAFIMATLVSHSAAAEPDEASERKKLTGVWRGHVVEGRGEQPNQRRIAIIVTIKGETITAVQADGKDLGEGTFTLRFGQSAKEINATRTKNPGRGQTFHGIYSLDGDTLRWCVSNPPGRERPTELQSKTGQFLMVLRREKQP